MESYIQARYLHSLGLLLDVSLELGGFITLEPAACQVGLGRFSARSSQTMETTLRSEILRKLSVRMPPLTIVRCSTTLKSPCQVSSPLAFPS